MFDKRKRSTDPFSTRKERKACNNPLTGRAHRCLAQAIC